MNPDLLRRAERSLARTDAWRAMRQDRPEALMLSADHTAALDALVADQSARLQAALAGDAEEVGAALTAFGMAWQLIDAVVDQRRDPARGRVLQMADLVAEDAWRGLGQAVPALAGRPSPLVVLESTTTPAIYRRDVTIAAPSFYPGAPNKLPIALPAPLVLMPPHLPTSPWLLSTLHHEVGHAASAELGLVAALSAVLSKRMFKDADVRPSWADELLADAFGCLWSGASFTLSLADLLSEIDPRVFDGNATYPPSADRVALLGVLHSAWGDPVPAAVVTGERGLSDEAIADVAAALLDLPIGDTSLRQLGDPARRAADRDAVAACAAVDGVPGDGVLAGVGWRLLPAVASARRRDGADDDAAEAWTRSVAARLPRPPWALDDGQWRLLRAALVTLEPTSRDGDGAKGPIDDLLVAHDDVVLLGATHWSVAPAIERVRAVGRKDRWSSLVLFALTDEALERLYGAEAPQRIAERDASLTRLRALLPDVADAWHVSLYDDPWYFASYWDWRRQGGRIHVSSNVPGVALTRAPSLDHVWTEAQPSSDFAAFAAGIEVRLAGLSPAT